MYGVGRIDKSGITAFGSKTCFQAIAEFESKLFDLTASDCGAGAGVDICRVRGREGADERGVAGSKKMSKDRLVGDGEGGEHGTVNLVGHGRWKGREPNRRTHTHLLSF